MEKKCNKCGEIKPLKEFTKAKAYKDGYTNKCKECRKEDRKESDMKYRQRPEVKAYMKEYHKNPEVKEQREKYRQRPEVKERKEEYMKEYSKRPEVKERAKEYSKRPEVKERAKERAKEYHKNPEVKERKKKTDKNYYDNNRNSLIEYNKKYYEENKDEVLKRIKSYRKEYKKRPDVKLKSRAYSSNRRTLKLNQSDGTITTDVFIALSKELIRCPYCNEILTDSKHVDHIYPVSKGGLHSINNLIVCCESCNLSKSDKLPITWFNEIGKDKHIIVTSIIEQRII